MTNYIIVYVNDRDYESHIYIKEAPDPFSLIKNFAEYCNGKDDLFVTAISSINFNDVKTFIEMYSKFYDETIVGVYEIKKALYEVE